MNAHQRRSLRSIQLQAWPDTGNKGAIKRKKQIQEGQEMRGKHCARDIRNSELESQTTSDRTESSKMWTE